jgi:hypothetical protein
MDSLRLADVAARLVAWHNRHPTARRLALTDVSSIGVVGLPHALREGGTAELWPLYGADWLRRGDAARLRAWVRRHGRPELPACRDWPLRLVDAELAAAHRADAEGLQGRCLRFVITALLSRDGHSTRVLLAGAADDGAVFGSRLAHPGRTAGLSALVAGGSVMLATWFAPGPAAPEAEPPAVAAKVPAAGEPPPVPLPAVVRPPRPPDVPIELRARADGAAPLVSLRPSLNEGERRAARVVAEAARQQAAAPQTASAHGRMYAIATLPTRTREDAEAQRVALQGLLARTATPQPTRLELMPSGRRWRVVWWPHAQRQAAQELLLQARARGLKAELIDF